MNNIQKAFQNKAKMSLRMAVGGLLPDPNGSDIDAINDEKTARWAAEDAAKQGLRGPAQGYKSYSGASQALAALAQPAGAQPTAQPTQPGDAPETTFEQDLTVRQGRIDGLRGKLNGMEAAGRANSLMGSNYADGGVVQETPDQLMARMASKYGTSGATPTATPTAQATPQPAPQPVAQPARPTGMFAGLKAALDPERRMRAAGLAAGGIVRGPGGPTDDKVPMTIGGVDVNLSNKEAVLPVKSVEAFGGPKAVEDFIEQTNGKPPVKSGLRAGGEYGDGAIDPEVLMKRVSEHSGLPYQPPTQVAGREQGGAIMQATLPKPPVQAPSVVAPSAPSLADAKPVARPWYAGTDSRDERSGLDMERARRADAVGMQGDPLKQMLTTGTLGDGARTQVATPAAAPAVIPASTAPVAQPAEAAAPLPEDSPNIRTLRSAGVTGDIQGDVSEWKKDALGRSYQSTGKTGVRTLGSGANAVYAGRDAKGQLNITSGMQKTDAEAEVGRAKEADRMSKGLRSQLANMQQMRLERNADEDITDVGLRTRSQATLDSQAKNNAALAAKAPSALDIAKFGLDQKRFDHELKKTDNLQGNSDREFLAKEDSDHTKRVDDLIKSWAGDEKDPAFNQKYAGLQKYASQFKRGKGMKSDEHLAELMDNFAVDNLFDSEGRHWATGEGVRSGEAVRPITREAGLGSWAHGRGSGQTEYVNPLTNETIYQSDVVRNLSPRQQQILVERVKEQQKSK